MHEETIKITPKLECIITYPDLYLDGEKKSLLMLIKTHLSTFQNNEVFKIISLSAQISFVNKYTQMISNVENIKFLLKTIE